ncbi:MAG: glycosyltransferase family 39 protein [Proteobacteria bacterium]|nr:glycosyltransferase family 39 protein [Pseudomonadota bacterium]MBU1736929.1 glycosyltransferase family 39 protein [Pseudomonadota bacterium]
MGKLKVLESVLLLSVVTLLVFPILYICRFLDTNTLVSWRWVFATVPASWVMVWLLAAVVCSVLVSWWVPLERYPGPFLFFLAIPVILPLWSEPELLLDSGRYFLQARHLAEYGFLYFVREWGREIPTWTDLPLIPMLYGLIFKMSGESRIAIQCFTTLLFALTTVLTAKIGEELWDRETGFYAGMMLFGMPYLMTQVVLMLVDVPAMFFLVLALHLFLLAISRGGGWMAMSVSAIVFAMLAKYSLWPMLLVLPLSALFCKGPDRRTSICRAGVVLFAAASVAALMIVLKFSLFSGQLEILLQYQKPALKLWREGYFSTFFFQISPLVSILALWALYRAWRTGNRQVLIATFFAVMVFGLQMKRIRYIIPLLPLLALLASFGLQAIREKMVRRFAALVIVSYSLVIAYTGYLPFFKTTSMMNIMEAGRFLDTLPGDTVELLALPQRTSGGNTVLAIPQLDLFTAKKIVSRQDWMGGEEGLWSSFAPLLFSWQIARPPFYRPEVGGAPLPLVVIADTTLPENVAAAAGIGAKILKKKFVSAPGVFRFQTNVFVYD